MKDVDTTDNQNHTIICIGVDFMLHVCFPWEKKTICGIKVKSKEVRDRDYRKRCSCYECSWYACREHEADSEDYVIPPTLHKYKK